MLLDALASVLPTLTSGMLAWSDQAPEPEDVKAGWTAFALFLAGIVAVGLLGWSLVRQLRKVEDARKRGVYGDTPETGAETGAETGGTAAGNDPGTDPVVERRDSDA